MAGLAALTLALLAFLLCPLTTLTLPTDNALTTSVSTSRPTATIDSGVVLGITKTENATGSRVNAFLGVPFAAEPIRWGPPESAAPWTSPFDASQYGPACVQRSSHLAAPPNSMLQWYNTPLPQESEDCLNACVYVPVSTNNTPKPVMVWLYDDGIFYGSNAMPHSDGSILAANEDVIVVVVNYRTNVFGFPGSPQIPITQNNLGYLDQRFALSWVQRNIAAFGGDPNKVTIFGEGEGARSIDALITQPPNPLTFHAAIMESGTNIFASVHASSASWVTLVAAMNCSSPTEDILGCMRAVPATTIKQFNVLNHLPWSPVIDNVTVAYTARSNRLSSTTQDSKIARVPILSGTNADEGRLLSVGADDFSTAIRGLFLGIPDAEVNRYLAQYPCNGPPGSGDYISGTFNGTLEQLGALYTDYLFQCPARLVQLDTTEAGVPSWRYYYNASFPSEFPSSLHFLILCL